MPIMFHGTSSAKAESIAREGFRPLSYFTASIEDARYYAATGGEWDLQAREEAFEAEHGERPRDVFDPWEMFRKLYPADQSPVVLMVEMTDEMLVASRLDAGADGGRVFDVGLPAAIIRSVEIVEWIDEIVESSDFTGLLP